MTIFGTSTHIKSQEQLNKLDDDDYLHLKKNFWGQEKLIAIKKGPFRDSLQGLRARFSSNRNQRIYNESVVNGIIKLFAKNDIRKSIILGEQLNTNSSIEGNLKITVGMLKNVLKDITPKTASIKTTLVKDQELEDAKKDLPNKPAEQEILSTKPSKKEIKKLQEQQLREITKQNKNKYFQQIGYERKLDNASGVIIFNKITDQKTEELLIRFAKALESLSSKYKNINIKSDEELFRGFFQQT
jgi:hypothetical protein